MKHVDIEGRVPILSWISAEELYGSETLLAQARNVSNLPGAFHHVALMPDAHSGFGMPIGGVLAMEDAICPGAVGFDIGCGMIATRTEIAADDLRPRIVELHRAIRKRVPVGEGGKRSSPTTEDPATDTRKEVLVDHKVADKWTPQLGTLGAGNHFIELDSDPEGRVWLVVHSGSRGTGHTIAGHYMKLAEKVCGDRNIPVPDRELAFLPADTEEFEAYRVAQNSALEYAFANRSVMASDALEALQHLFGDIGVSDQINVHHNFAALEHHFGRNVWVHRKGATRAREGEQLVIPGSMGQGSVIGTGLGNPDSFDSCSHGAGRRMGRKEARRTLDLATERAKLTEQGIMVSAGRDGALDEMPPAYKDLDEVMEAQADLVRVGTRLTPIGVVKG